VTTSSRLDIRVDGMDDLRSSRNEAIEKYNLICEIPNGPELIRPPCRVVSQANRDVNESANHAVEINHGGPSQLSPEKLRALRAARRQRMPDPRWCLLTMRLVHCPAQLSLTTSALAFNAAVMPMRPVAPAMGRLAQSVRMEAEAPAQAPAAAPAVEKPAAAPEVVMSQALPFLVRRASLGPVGKYVGDVGFDPVGWTEIFPIEWLREAEIKHSRVAMLAFLGFVFTDFYHLPGFDYTTLEAHDATVASGAMSQLLLWIGLLEVISTISIDQMLRGSGREPGDFGFDPIGFGSDPVKLKELQMKELANGRLAMFAFGGVVTQSVLTGNSFPYLFGDAETFGSGGNFAWNVVVTASMP